MKTKSILLLSSALLSLTACGPSAEEKSKQEQRLADSTGVQALSSNAAVENKNDTTHKFIRTADLKFKVKNVFQSTNHIESIVSKHGGFVTYTNLTSHIRFTESSAVSEDSLIESTHFLVDNDMVLRVPNYKLDTVLKEMASQFEYLDYRIIKAEDVALQLLSSQMAQSRSQKSTKRLSRMIVEKPAKLIDATSAEAAVTEQEAVADESVLKRKSLNDQINFSTVRVQLYGREEIKREKLKIEATVKNFEPSFGTQLIAAFQTGLSSLEVIILLLMKAWVLLLIAITGVFLWKRHNLK